MDHFRGMVDNLVIDNYRYNLWNSAQSHDGVKYAVPRYKPIYYPADGKAVSFYGNGFLQHAVGQFNVSSGYASVELDFRTLHQNGIIMAISSEEQRYVLVLYLHNGQVKYFFELGENDGITMTSSGWVGHPNYRIILQKNTFIDLAFLCSGLPKWGIAYCDFNFIELALTGLKK